MGKNNQLESIISLISNKKTDAAKKYLNESLQKAPQNIYLNIFEKILETNIVGSGLFEKCISFPVYSVEFNIHLLLILLYISDEELVHSFVIALNNQAENYNADFFVKISTKLEMNNNLPHAELLIATVEKIFPQSFVVFQKKLESLVKKRAVMQVNQLVSTIDDNLPWPLTAFNDIANLLSDSQFPASAVRIFQIALKKDKINPVIYHNMGRNLILINQLDGAEKCFQLAIQLKPEFIDPYIGLALLYEKKNDFETAINYYEKVKQLAPEHLDSLNKLALAYRKIGDYDKAEIILTEALETDPDHIRLLNSIGNIQMLKGKYHEARTSYNRAIKNCSEFHEARFSRSLLDLLFGNFKDGWQEYENRWYLKSLNPKTLNGFRWNAQPVKNKTVLLIQEQGLGDTIQFARYAELIQNRGGRAILACRDSLIKIMNSLKSVEHVVDDTKTFEFHYDYYVPLMSLPGIFQTTIDTIPSSGPYLDVEKSDQDAMRAAVDPSSRKLSIGIVWGGNPALKNDKKRSLKLSYFEKLFSIKKTEFYSIQKGIRVEELRNSEYPISNLDGLIKNFYDTAAIIKNLDLIITVDTSVAHLAGALGKPVWILLPFNPDWRWLLERDNSPWYHSARLFRQKSIDNWESVFDELATAIASFTKNKKGH